MRRAPSAVRLAGPVSFQSDFTAAVLRSASGQYKVVVGEFDDAAVTNHSSAHLDPRRTNARRALRPEPAVIVSISIIAIPAKGEPA
jgi:hypothetical protein